MDHYLNRSRSKRLLPAMDTLTGLEAKGSFFLYILSERELCQKLDIQEVMDLIENEDLSDIELGVGSDEEDLQEYEVVPISRPGPDILTRHEAQLLERNVRDEENDLRDNLDGSEEESGTMRIRSIQWRKMIWMQ
ncbi:hypothetical protein JTB14_004119 [Gonioctena quinquepunctata]|nr:hypothetical protein JTB14_004119 [Gonioctena quinquepunctata]